LYRIIKTLSAASAAERVFNYQGLQNFKKKYAKNGKMIVDINKQY
jgi:lysylphosphatidylglycerol synthetase-like protein (DUF2156 family)